MRDFIKQLFWFVLIVFLFNNQAMAQEPYFGKNKVQYKSFDWHFIQTENFDIYYYQGNIIWLSLLPMCWSKLI